MRLNVGKPRQLVKNKQELRRKIYRIVKTRLTMFKVSHRGCSRIQGMIRAFYLIKMGRLKKVVVLRVFCFDNF